MKLPADASILEAFENPDTSHLDVFPLGEPFKCLYTVHALREHLNTRRLRSLVRTNATDTGSSGATGQKETHLKTMSLVVAAIEDTNVIGRCRTEALQIELSQHLLDAFLQLLTGTFSLATLFLVNTNNWTESAVEHTVDQFLTKEFQERLVTLLLEASAVQHSHHAAEVINCALHALLECCSLSKSFWELFRQNPSTKRIVQDLLRDHRLSVRKSTGKLIKAKCTFTQAGSHTPALEFAETFWPFAFELLPQVASRPLPSEEIFTLLSLLMHKLYQEKSAALGIQACVSQLLELILGHTSTEDISNPNQVDLVANGLLTLLHYGIKHFSDSEGRGISFAPGVVRRLFYKHLFPKIGNRDRLVPRVIFSQENRTLLFTILHLLIKDDSNQQEVMLTALTGLVPYTSGEAENSPYLYDLPQGFDRLRAVRAPGGHAGLRNLSNTCYLNSLFTQLFMNVHFRKFMLQVPVADPRGHQLLFHTQELFAELQDSIRRSIDPSLCVAQIMNYEETPIDIHTQMDVDEFYNLLFDRWESQMPNTRAKMRMRSFYGGQLVQQVKSKECEHISERIEPFSAIQCDIKGISSLQESLQTYVDGEIMEGDNKYKCEKCNRHVDAVKRACLKEIPDHLIFHLKRFSFDLRTLQRNKINDHFDFPAEIDLSPFTVEHLSDSSSETPPDVFELVGVLVHAGTAESGHYYSYIRERPTSDGTQPWFEFNDETVSPWDPANLAGSCFGGRDATSRFDGGLGFDKAYSAYMLFYQRASSLKQDHVDLRDSGKSHPVRVDVDPVTLDTIKEDNWNIVHRYCTNDESLSRFRQLLLLRTLGHQVPHEHGAKNLAMEVALGHLDQVSARAKDTPDFLPLFSKIRQACEECADCSLHFFRYFQHRPEALRMLLMRNVDPNIRQSMGDLLVHVLKTIKNQLPEEYNPQDVDPDDQALDLHEAQPSALRAVVCLFNILWDTFQTSLRAWPELFGTMAQFASISNIEGGALLEEDYLLKLFMVLIADVTDQALPQQYLRLATTLFKRQRPPSFDAIIQLIDILMSYLQPDLADQDFPETAQGRLALALKGQKLSYTTGEINQLHASFPRMRYSILVDKLIQLNQNLTSTESIIKRLLDLDPMMDTKVFTTLVDGLNNCQQDIPLIPVYLQGIVFYLRWSRNAESVQYLMKLVVSTCKTVTSAEGAGFINFFRTTFSMMRETEPHEAIVESRSFEDLPTWAPVLLGSTDSNVRSDMDLFLKQMLWAWLDNYKLQSGGEDDDLDDLMHDRVKCVKRLTIYCLKYLHERYVAGEMQAPRNAVATLLDTIHRGGAYFSPIYADDHPQLDVEYQRLKPGK